MFWKCDNLRCQFKCKHKASEIVEKMRMKIKLSVGFLENSNSIL